MKIKNFQFCLSNCCGNDLHNNADDWKQKVKVDRNHPYVAEKEIDKKINRWIEKNNAIVKDIKVTTYTIDRHNNGGDDTVIAIYTLTYDLPEGVETTEPKKEEA